MIIGITRGTKAGHLARASLESIAYQVVDLIDAMQEDSGISISVLRVDGGAARNNTLLQFQADLLGIPVVRPADTETTALGVAFLAGLAVGFWKTQDEIQAQWKVDRQFHPQRPKTEVQKLLSRWHEALGRAKAWSEPETRMSKGPPSAC
jgi:glycerol kinase